MKNRTRKNKKLNNDNGNVELEWFDGIFAAMVTLSLDDYHKQYPRIKAKKVRINWYMDVYLKKCQEIDNNKADAIFFFDSPNSIFNKYYHLNKEFLIKHYGEKYRNDARKNQPQEILARCMDRPRKNGLARCLNNNGFKAWKHLPPE